MDQQVLDTAIKYGVELFGVAACYIGISLLRRLRDWAKSKDIETVTKISEISERYLRQRVQVAVSAVEQMAKTDESLKGSSKLDLASGMLLREGITVDRHDIESAVRQMTLWDTPMDCGVK